MTAPVARTRAPRMTKAQARKLTDRIAGTAGELWSLLAEAHDGEAWRALGYDTWTAYVDAEFAITRGQAFRLLDQARVAGALEAAVGEPVAVSARQAAVLRHQPDKAAKRVAKSVVKGKPVDVAIVDEVERVRSARTSKERATEGGDPNGSPTPTRASGGAAATAEKVAEAPTAAPKPARSSTPPGGEDQAPSGPSPSVIERVGTGAAPATADGVRHMVAMVTTTGADVLAHCCEARTIAAAIDTLTAALKRLTKPPANGSAARPVPATRRDVTPRLKNMR